MAHSLEEAGFESYDLVEIHRSQLKNAPYNPRTLHESAKKKLKAGLKRHGLVSPPTWNERTGFIVGGHQRISIMDSLMGKADYTLKVAKINVDDNREKELNILLNNTASMGDWDIGALGELLENKELSIEGTGFDTADIYKMFGEASFKDRGEDLKALGDQLREIQEAYKNVATSNRDRNNEEFYLVLVFANAPEMTEFLVKYDLPDNRYQNPYDWIDKVKDYKEPIEDGEIESTEEDK
jgi:hypothetical protein